MSREETRNGDISTSFSRNFEQIFERFRRKTKKYKTEFNVIPKEKRSYYMSTKRG